jgi:hypothetical protein
MRVPTGVDATEAAAIILSWTTAYQLLHRATKVKRGQHVTMLKDFSTGCDCALGGAFLSTLAARGRVRAGHLT